jgi:hypothetical protein
VLDVGLPEAPGHVVGGLAHHPGVGPAEELDPVHAEDLGRLEALGGAAQGELLALGEHARDRLAQLAARGEHEHDPVPGVGGAGEQCHRWRSTRRRGGRGS